MPFVAKYYGERFPPPRGFSDGIERKAEDRLLQWGTTRGSRGASVVLHAARAVVGADPIGVRAKSCGGIFAYADDISIGKVEIPPDAATFLQRELANIGFPINPSKTVCPWLPKGHVPTPE